MYVNTHTVYKDAILLIRALYDERDFPHFRMQIYSDVIEIEYR